LHIPCRSLGADALAKPGRPKDAIGLLNVDNIDVHDLVVGEILFADRFQRCDGLSVTRNQRILQVFRPLAGGIEPYGDAIGQAVGGENLVGHC